jgi:hypothetical protein
MVKELAVLFIDEKTFEITIYWKNAKFGVPLETFCKEPLAGKEEKTAQDFFKKLREDGIL